MKLKRLGIKSNQQSLVHSPFLWLGKEKGATFNRFDLLAQLLPVYVEIINALAAEGVEYIQIDEPALTLDLPTEWLRLIKRFTLLFAEQVKAKLLLRLISVLWQNTLIC